MVKKTVTMIPATAPKGSVQNASPGQKRRVAAYARVSTDSDEQFTSYEAQIDYYTKYISDRKDWVFVEVYADEGISGTSTKHREGFNRMIADALSGKIDLIVTKSISRFARNTVDTLTTVRKLKEKGIEVFFEKENIYTLDSKGELLIPSCPPLPRKRAAQSPKTSRGVSVSALRTERSPCLTNAFWDTRRAGRKPGNCRKRSGDRQRNLQTVLRGRNPDVDRLNADRAGRSDSGRQKDLAVHDGRKHSNE